ncbi:MAG TPA: cupin domain-containing protein [Candidatus Tectomicrobia bacterium]
MVDKPLTAGITRAGEGEDGFTWQQQGRSSNTLLKALCTTTFCFETYTPPGNSVSLHVHLAQDEFIYVVGGQVEVQVAEMHLQANPGDLVRLPRGVPHGYANLADVPARLLFWVSPADGLKELFDVLQNVGEAAEVIRLSAEHDVIFLPPRV